VGAGVRWLCLKSSGPCPLAAWTSGGLGLGTLALLSMSSQPPECDAAAVPGAGPTIIKGTDPGTRDFFPPLEPNKCATGDHFVMLAK
jgi:hypothetical protein